MSPQVLARRDRGGARPAPLDTRAQLDATRLAVAAGAPAPASTGLPDRAVHALELARTVGAPMLPAIDAARQVDDDVREARRAVTVAAAQARAVAIGLLLAPVVLVPLLGRMLGADVAGFYATGLGRLVGALGVALLALGAVAIAWLIRRVGRPRAVADARPLVRIAVAVAFVSLVAGSPAVAALAALGAFGLRGRTARHEAFPDPDQVADLTAIALGGGVAVPSALREVADRLPHNALALRRLAFGLELGMPAALALDHRPADDPLRRLADLLSEAERLGAPVVPELRRLAHDLRAEALAEVLAEAERLPVLLTFPTALCLLPATVLLVGAPIVHTGLRAVGT
ncbi:MAG: type II secretion system F family protein [Nitriliruptoraceae bacterium]|nr:type II secretion system F family protein [Nitriliruptoraceae bacterium]